MVLGEARGEAGLGYKNKTKQKPSRGGSVLASKVRAVCKSGRGDLVGAGYAGVEVLGGRDRVRHVEIQYCTCVTPYLRGGRWYQPLGLFAW